MRQMEEKNINKLQINERATLELRRGGGHAHSAGFRTPGSKLDHFWISLLSSANRYLVRFETR